MTTTTIQKTSSLNEFGLCTTYTFDILANNGNKINEYMAVVDEFDDVEAIVYFCQDEHTSEEKSFSDINKAHKHAVNGLLKQKNSY